MTLHFTVERLPGLPILLLAISNGFRAVREVPLAEAQARAILDDSSEPLYNLIDISGVDFSIEEMVITTNQTARAENAFWHDPRVIETILISDSSLVQMAAAGLNSLAFGHLRVRVVAQRETALAYVRQQLQVSPG